MKNLLLLSFVIFLLSCSTATDPDNTVTFSGTVTLEGTDDFSGVTVSLYEPVEPDTALVRINEEYPDIGVQISQETEFDHREHEPVKSTTTAADGSWKIKASEGTYNIVVEKEGYGWRYNYTNDGSNSLTTSLLQEQELEGVISSDLILETQRHYVITGNVTIAAGNTVTIGPGVWVRFDGNYKFEINAPLHINGSAQYPVHFTANTQIASDNAWRSLLVQNTTQVTVEHLILKNSSSGLQIINTSQALVANSCFTSNTVGMYVNACDDLEANHLNFANNEQGLIINDADFELYDNIFTANEIATEVSDSESDILRNLYDNNFIGLTLFSGEESAVFNCVFIKNENSGLNIIGDSTIVQYNVFTNNVECAIYTASEYSGSGAAYPTINNNNIFNNGINLSQAGNSYYFGASYRNYVDIDAQYNYWGFEFEELILTKIIDEKDDFNFGIVYINNYKQNMLENVGIIK